jgi:hypothetical protein
MKTVIRNGFAAIVAVYAIFHVYYLVERFVLCGEFCSEIKSPLGWPTDQYAYYFVLLMLIAAIGILTISAYQIFARKIDWTRTLTAGGLLSAFVIVITGSAKYLLILIFSIILLMIGTGWEEGVRLFTKIRRSIGG